MVVLGIGVRLRAGDRTRCVGIGVDYASICCQSTRPATCRAVTHGRLQKVQFTGKVVALMGLRHAGVITWACHRSRPTWAPAHLHTRVEIVGALVLIPALSYFLLPTAVVLGASSSAKPTRNLLPAPEVDAAVRH
jgi:hypothetical protein